jgi:hypothetical protein
MIHYHERFVAPSDVAWQEIRIAGLLRPTYALANEGHPSGSCKSFGLSTPLELLHKGLEIHLVPALYHLVIFNDQKRRPVQGSLPTGRGKA